MLRANLLGSTTLFALCLLSLGCDLFSSSSTPTTPTAPASLAEALNCIVGKTINITGDYRAPPFGRPVISIDREASISANLFKVTETGGDELAERSAEETKIDTWEADYVGLTLDGTHGYGYNDETEEDCYNVEYKKGPFSGPAGAQCTMSASARICEDTCFIENAEWKLMCGVATDGTGGDLRASGAWSVQSP